MTATEVRVGPRVVTTDAVEIATYDLGGTGPVLIFAHATGLHGRVWIPVAAELRASFHCFAFDARGHGDSNKAPGGDYDWAGFGLDVQAVATSLGSAGSGRPWAVGHSSGGTALLLAEEAAPATFAAMYCFEPVLFLPGVTGDEGDRLAAGARRRRPVFASRVAVLDSYAAKPAFARFDPVALEAYVRWGFRDRPDGTVELACRPADEARVYEQAPSNGVYDRLDRISCAVTLATGGRGAAFGADVVSAVAARIAGPTRVEVHEQLGHFGPLEQPAEIAASILAAFAATSLTARRHQADPHARHGANP